MRGIDLQTLLANIQAVQRVQQVGQQQAEFSPTQMAIEQNQQRDEEATRVQDTDEARAGELHPDRGEEKGRRGISRRRHRRTTAEGEALPASASADDQRGRIIDVEV